MKRDFAIKDTNSGLFVQCWTEGETIFLTPDWEKAERYKSLEDATSMKNRINHCAERFLKDEDQSEIACEQVSLSAGKLTIQVSFDLMG